MAKRITTLLRQVQTTCGTKDGYYGGPSEMMDNFNTAQNNLMNFLTGLLKDYRDQRPVSPVSSQVSFDVVGITDPFRPVNGIDCTLQSDGTFLLVPPTDRTFAKIEAFFAGEEQVTFPSIARLPAFIKNPNRTPIPEVPIGKSLGERQYQLYPSGMQTLRAQVVLMPPPSNIVFDAAYQVDDALTTEMLWDDTASPFLYYGMCKEFGIAACFKCPCFPGNC